MPRGTANLVGFAPSFLCTDQMLDSSFCAVECHTKHIITLHIKISLYFCTIQYLDKALNHCVVSGSIFSLHCHKHLFRSIIRTTYIKYNNWHSICTSITAALSLSLSSLHPSLSHLQICTSLGLLASLTGCEPYSFPNVGDRLTA